MLNIQLFVLINLCFNSDLRIGVKCLDRHMKICFTQEQTLVYRDLVNPAKEFIHQLCDDVKTQAGQLIVYLKS